MAAVETIQATTKSDIAAALTAKEAAQIDMFGFVIDTPGILLIAFVVFFCYIVWQSKLGKEWGDAFKDEGGKPSFTRFGVLACILISGWIVMMWASKVTPTPELVQYALSLFVIVWSCAKPVDKLIDIAAIKFGLKPPNFVPAPPIDVKKET